ncbi:hypothetical protein V1512DRAFT_238235 [Lipomyces arxii]|uniref:uncharacterized protein n=1 Tax=Lipomyces arxii TaxID=56418 RepID=UPI0034CE8753
MEIGAQELRRSTSSVGLNNATAMQAGNVPTSDCVMAAALAAEKEALVAELDAARNSAESSSAASYRSDDDPQSMTTMKGDTVPYFKAQPDRNFNGPVLAMNIPRILPHEQVFSIQVGDILFRLSGASLSSDGPSYFTAFFKSQQRKGSKESPILYIDRSPEVFRDIVRHLQGYSVIPRDEYHFVYLYADAHYYQLPKLVKLLFNSEIFVRIGSKSFKIPRELLSRPGDSPNFFTLGFSSFFASPQDVFPGTKGLIRPPSVAPPSVPAHSDVLFEQLIQALKGTPIEYTSEKHREALIRECRYYHFRGLEQRLIPVDISKNLLTGREEITLRIKDVRPAQVTVDSLDSERLRLSYKRPFTDEPTRELVLQIDANELVLRSYDHVESNSTIMCRWGAQVMDGSVAAERLQAIIKALPEIQSHADPYSPIRLPSELQDAVITLDGNESHFDVRLDGYVQSSTEETVVKRRKVSESDDQSPTPMPAVSTILAVTQAQAKLVIMNGVLVLSVLAIDLVSSAKHVNRRRRYVS